MTREVKHSPLEMDFVGQYSRKQRLPLTSGIIWYCTYRCPQCSTVTSYPAQLHLRPPLCNGEAQGRRRSLQNRSQGVRAA